MNPSELESIYDEFASIEELGKFNVYPGIHGGPQIEYYSDCFDEFDRFMNNFQGIRSVTFRLKYNFTKAGRFSSWADSIQDLDLWGGKKSKEGRLIADWTNQFPSLERLTIRTHVEIPESVLLGLPKLGGLNVQSSKMPTFYQVTSIPTLRSLSLYLPDIGPLDFTLFAPSPGLNALGITKKSLRVPDLSQFPNLEELALGQGVKDLNPLASLHRLKRLDLAGNNSITSFAPLAGLPIEKLLLSVKRVDSLIFLLDLANLQDVEFWGKCVIGDEDVVPILEHPSLKRCCFGGAKTYCTRLFAGKSIPTGLNLVY